MAFDRRKSIAVLGALLALIVLLGWGWADGGERALSPHSTPAMLPRIGQ